MKITQNQIKKLNPCKAGWAWYLKNQEDDLEQLLVKINEHNPDWSRWLFTKLMNKKQCVEIAIFSAKEVLYIFEAKYPKDKRPRKALEATEKYLKVPTEKNRVAATSSYADAYAAAAYYASATDASTASYASAAYAYASAAGKELQEKIIKEAVTILDRETT